MYPSSCKDSHPVFSFFLSQGFWRERKGQLLLIGWMRPRFDVAPLCQTCQEKKMDSYRGRGCNRRGWQGGVDSRLTAVINHLPHQPDAGWQKGACWLEWRFVHSLPEMSSCQPVSCGMLSVINPSDRLSINSFFQGQACMWHAPFNSDIAEMWRCFIDIF